MLLGSLQENLLTLLVYNEDNFRTIRSTIDLNLYGGHYRIIAARIYDYIDKFQKPPKDHLPDILTDKIESKNKREADLYVEVVESIHDANKHINVEYVMSQLGTFVERQALRGFQVELTKALQRDTDESIEEAREIISKINTKSLSVFDPGIRLSDKTRALSFLDSANSALPTGIPELDRRGFGPTRKELNLFIGNTKAGKTFWLVHLAKMALISRVRACHITLEMSEARCSQRYLQALFAIAKRKEIVQTTKIKKDKLGRIEGFDPIRIMPKLTLDNPNIKKQLEKLIDKWSLRLLDNIFIKQFPTGQLTINQLNAYLDNLETTQKFVPDLLIIDYPDLMKLDKANFRLSLDEVYKDLRGIMVKRNIAGAVVSQSHRSAAKAKVVGADNVAEAYSKIAHCDTIITYTQTPQEATLGLARLHVAGGRNDSDRFTIVISQQYATGGFVIDSALMSGNYWGNVPAGGSDE